jgi:hypothetical protein
VPLLRLFDIMMKVISICILAVAVLVWGCNESSTSEARQVLQELSSPVGHGGEPNLFVMEDGRPILSWVEYVNDTTDALMFSIFEKDKWSEGKMIAQGSDWFVNWADFPSVAVFHGSSESMAAHWLQKSARGTFDYDVRIAQSNDGGDSWGESFIVHRDGIPAEHGFVTMIAVSESRVFATWLDGRNTKGEENTGQDDHGHHGAMSLRTAQFDRSGNLYEEYELDVKTCDCCQTDAAMTSQGMVVVYRDRSDDEVRDISIVREQASGWTKPVTVHDDGWEIAGCPVNGPAIAADGDFVALAWHTEAGDEPKLLIALSRDAGASFSGPVRIDNGGTMGRVDVSILENETIFVTWLENGDEGAHILGAHLDKDAGILNKSTLVKTDPTRNSGFPVLENTKDGLMLAWTHTLGGESTVKTGIIDFE